MKILLLNSNRPFSPTLKQVNRMFLLVSAGNRVHGQPGQVSPLLRGRQTQQRPGLEERHGEPEKLPAACAAMGAVGKKRRHLN